MGQIKRLLDVIDSVYPDDLDSDYQSFVEQQELEKLAYEELLSDTYKTTYNEN